MLRVGLTGGIGAGKSAVSARLVSLGAVLVDADQLAREVVGSGTPGLAAVTETFGTAVLGPDGTLDRAALGRRVFGDDQARAKLNAIVHPLVRLRAEELLAEAPEEGIVVHDVPLLVENSMAAGYHLVVVVEAPEEVRLSRLAERGLSAADAQARMRTQATNDQRRQAADVLLDNSGTVEELATQIDQLWQRRLVPFERNLRLGHPAWRWNPACAMSGPPSLGQRRLLPVSAMVPESEAASRLIRRLKLVLGGWAVEIGVTTALFRDFPSSSASPGSSGFPGSPVSPGLPGSPDPPSFPDPPDLIEIQVRMLPADEADPAAGRAFIGRELLAELLAEAGFPPLPSSVLPSPADPDFALGQCGRFYGSADPGCPALVEILDSGSELADRAE